MVREGGEPAMTEVTETLDFNTPEFVEAGNQLQRSHRHGAFPARLPGRAVGRPGRRVGTIGTGQAAISLMGQWGPRAYANQSGIGTPEDPIADRLRRVRLVPLPSS